MDTKNFEIFSQEALNSLAFLPVDDGAVPAAIRRIDEGVFDQKETGRARPELAQPLFLFRRFQRAAALNVLEDALEVIEVRGLIASFIGKVLRRPRFGISLFPDQFMC